MAETVLPETEEALKATPVRKGSDPQGKEPDPSGG
jgi:hypothetical protein